MTVRTAFLGGPCAGSYGVAGEVLGEPISLQAPHAPGSMEPRRSHTYLPFEVGIFEDHAVWVYRHEEMTKEEALREIFVLLRGALSLYVPGEAAR